MKKMVVHVGYPKTGTSTIQDLLFTDMHDRGKINFLGKSNLKRYNSSVNLVKEIVYPEQPRSKSRILTKDGINVISNEDIVMSFYGINDRKFVKSSDPIATARRLYSALSELDIDSVEIIISIRNQRELIYSFYVEMWRWYFRHEPNLDTFDKYLNNGFANGKDGIFRMFYFSDIIKEYNALFGKDKVHVTLFEDMSNNTKKFCEHFCSPLELDPRILESIIKNNSLNVKRKVGDSYVIDNPTLYDEISALLEKWGVFTVTRKIFSGDNRFKNFLRSIAEHALERISIEQGNPVDRSTYAWEDLASKEFFICNQELTDFGVDLIDLERYGYLTT